MSKSFGAEGPAIPHLSRGEVADLRGDVEDGFALNESRVGFPRIDKLDQLTVSVGDTDQDFAITGENFSDVAADVEATVGGLAMTVEVDPADTTVTLRLAVGTGLTIGDTALLHMSVAGVAVLPVSLEVVA